MERVCRRRISLFSFSFSRLLLKLVVHKLVRLFNGITNQKSSLLYRITRLLLAFTCFHGYARRATELVGILSRPMRPRSASGKNAAAAVVVEMLCSRSLTHARSRSPLICVCIVRSPPLAVGPFHVQVRCSTLLHVTPLGDSARCLRSLCLNLTLGGA